MIHVSRQHQWPDGEFVVEINTGGADHANPGQLVGKYAGEGDEYADPREAVETAIRIAQQWQTDCPGDVIRIGKGNTGGDTMPFDGEELCEETFVALREWADRKWDKLPKCDHCGDVITGRAVILTNGYDEKFCREYCADEWERDQAEFEEEMEFDDDDE